MAHLKLSRREFLQASLLLAGAALAACAGVGPEAATPSPTGPPTLSKEPSPPPPPSPESSNTPEPSPTPIPKALTVQDGVLKRWDDSTKSYVLIADAAGAPLTADSILEREDGWLTAIDAQGTTIAVFNPGLSAGYAVSSGKLQRWFEQGWTGVNLGSEAGDIAGITLGTIDDEPVITALGPTQNPRAVAAMDGAWVTPVSYRKEYQKGRNPETSVIEEILQEVPGSQYLILNETRYFDWKDSQWTETVFPAKKFPFSSKAYETWVDKPPEKIRFLGQELNRAEDPTREFDWIWQNSEGQPLVVLSEYSKALGFVSSIEGGAFTVISDTRLETLIDVSQVAEL